MRNVTGIELRADSAVLVSARSAPDRIRVSAVTTVAPDADGVDGPLPARIQAARRVGRFPRHASVVAWGLPEGASLTDPATRAALGPVFEAGFAVDEVLPPAGALVALARRTRPHATGTTCWVAANRHGAALAFVSGGELRFAREFTWHYRAVATPREELLQRYSLVAHLAVELRHGVDVLQRAGVAPLESVVTCGDLPDLRSLTLPLIEELDVEVETLDSTDGLELTGAAADDWMTERVPAAWRLACAAASTGGARPRWVRPAVGAAAAVVLVSAAALWALGDRRVVAPEPAAVVPAPAAALPEGNGAGAADAPRGERAAAARERAPEAADAVAPEREAQAAATSGRVEPPAAGEARSGARDARDGIGAPGGGGRPEVRMAPMDRERRAATSGAGAPAARRGEPLRAPLPAVNSILVAPERRLAVLDGAIVREGDAVGPRILVSIEPGAVLLREPSGHQVRVPIRRRAGAEPR